MLLDKMASLLFGICLLFALGGSNRGEWGQIKINEPKSSTSTNNNNNNYGRNSNSNSGSASSSAAYRDPHFETSNSEIVTQSVGEYLIGRKGETVEGKYDKYTYKVELFNKVTQSENWYSWNLGIFDKWDYCDSTHTEICLVYTDGQVCGSGVARSSHVHIVCDIGDRDASKEQLFDISEPLTCSYHINMYVPQVCDSLQHDITKIMANNHAVGADNKELV